MLQYTTNIGTFLYHKFDYSQYYKLTITICQTYCNLYKITISSTYCDFHIVTIYPLYCDFLLLQYPIHMVTFPSDNLTIYVYIS